MIVTDCRVACNVQKQFMPIIGYSLQSISAVGNTQLSSKER
jgi:hypothetical protein